MDIHLLLGDNDPHLPRLTTMHTIAHFLPASLNSFTDTGDKFIKLVGTYDRSNHSASIENISNRLAHYLNKRICICDSLEKYFLRDALFTDFQHQDERKWKLTFKCDERTFRDEDFFAEDPLQNSIENIEELLCSLDQKIQELQNISDSLEITEPAREEASYEILLFQNIFEEFEIEIKDTVKSLCIRAKKKPSAKEILNNIWINEITMFRHVENITKSIKALLSSEQLVRQRTLFNRKIESLINEYDCSDVG